MDEDSKPGHFWDSLSDKEKRNIERPHVIFDDENGTVSFRKDHPDYIIERDAFRAHGIDIDQVVDIDDYMEKSYQCFRTFMAIWKAKILNDPRNDLSTRISKALVSDDMDEVRRLQALKRKKEKLGLRIV